MVESFPGAKFYWDIIYRNRRKLEQNKFNFDHVKSFTRWYFGEKTHQRTGFLTLKVRNTCWVGEKDVGFVIHNHKMWAEIKSSWAGVKSKKTKKQEAVTWGESHSFLLWCKDLFSKNNESEKSMFLILWEVFGVPSNILDSISETCGGKVSREKKNLEGIF